MGMMAPQQQQSYGVRKGKIALERMRIETRIFQVPPQSMGAGPPQGQFNQYMQPQGPMGGQMANQYQPQQQQTFMNPPAAMGPTQTPTPEPAATPMAPQPKAPLPEEYVYLQTVFNELRQQCSNAAANPVRDDQSSECWMRSLFNNYLYSYSK